MDKIKRRLEAAGFLISCVIVAFCLAAAYMGNRGREAYLGKAYAGANAGVDVFEEFRNERAFVREMETVQLAALAKDADAPEEIRLEAARMLNRLTEYMEAEATIEGILFLRGHERAVVSVHASSVNVVIEEGAADKNERAFILDLVMRETGQTAGNVKIMETGKS